MLKNKMAIKKTLPAFGMFLCILISLAVFGGGKAEAKYEKSAMTTAEWKKATYTSYFVTITHKAEMVQGDLIVKISDPLKFSYLSELFFNAYAGGFWDSPYGIWVNPVIENKNVKKWDNIKAYVKNAGTVSSGIIKLTNNFLFFSNPGSIHNEYAYATVFGIESETNITSSDPNIIECLGMSCVAKNSGKATLSIQGTPTDILPWDAYHKYVSNIGDYWSHGYDSEESLDFPNGVLFWDITVLPNASCVGGANLDNATICSGDDKNLIANLDKKLVSSCSETQKCEYVCNSGYKLENGACVLPTEPVVPPVIPPVVVPPVVPPVLIPSSSGACGGDVDGKTFCQTPSRSKLCTVGSTASVVTLADGKWTWSCKGSDNVPVSCSAIKNCAWTEVNP